MIFKKKEFFLLIFLIFLQSCSGGRIGNFLESSFNDLEKTIQNENLQNNLVNKKIKKVENSQSILENKKDTNLEKTSQNENLQNNLVNKKILVKENNEINGIKNKKIKKVENPRNVLENKKDINLEKIPKPKNNKIKNSSKKRKIELQSYKIIFILKDVDPKDPTKDLNTILSNSDVNFEIEKIERYVYPKNKSVTTN